MNYGYVKVAAAVPRVKVADCKFNASEIEKEIIIADGKGVQIIAFPELCITGYTCGDLFAQQLLLEEAEMGLIQILNNTRQMDIISILGMPVALNGVLLNAAVVIQKGRVLGVVPKTEPSKRTKNIPELSKALNTRKGKNQYIYSTAKGNRRSELPNHTATCGANKHTTPHSTAKNKEEITTACVTLIRAVFNFP